MGKVKMPETKTTANAVDIGQLASTIPTAQPFQRQQFGAQRPNAGAAAVGAAMQNKPKGYDPNSVQELLKQQGMSYS